MKKKQNIKLKFLILISLILIISILLYYENKEYHTHADFKVIIHSQTINFSNEIYQSSGFNYLDESVHLHDGNGEVIHHHKKDINLQRFFSSLNITYNNTCFDIYCINNTHNLKTFVNDKEIFNGFNYIFNDLDRILIIYDLKNKTNYDVELNEVSDKACIESARCPQRGEPSEGSCVTGSSCIVKIEDFE